MQEIDGKYVERALIFDQPFCKRARLPLSRHSLSAAALASAGGTTSPT
jgi:hypothetical protein